MFVQGAILCLAMNIYHEARGEPLLGQIAVGAVTMNRAKGDVREICPVVYAHKQFSWTSQKRDPFLHPPAKDRSWQQAQRLANRIIKGELEDVTNGATYFHAHWAKPSWRHSFERTTRIGNHIFYAHR